MWAPIPGWEGYYEVSDDGQVRSLDRVITGSDGIQQLRRGRVLKPQTQSRSDHQFVTLSRDAVKSFQRVHRLVLTAFTGPAPADAQCRHLDGDPTNNSLDNLAWGTQSENTRDAVKHGTHLGTYRTAKRGPRGSYKKGISA